MCPGAIHTPLLERILAAQPAFREATTEAATLKRIGDPDEVADAIVFLVSASGSFVHGSAMVVDGGSVNNTVGLNQ